MRRDSHLREARPINQVQMIHVCAAANMSLYLNLPQEVSCIRLVNESYPFAVNLLEILDRMPLYASGEYRVFDNVERPFP